MNIFLKIKNSIYNPKYYSEVVEKPFSYSLKYYLVFVLLIALVFSVSATIKFIPTQKFIIENFPTISSYFPQELEIKIKDGKVSTNVKEPYTVKVPDFLKNPKNTNPDMPNIDNFIIIDTKNKFDLENFSLYKTAMLLTESKIIYTDSRNQITINSLNDIKDYTLNKGVIQGYMEKTRPYLAFILPLFFIFSYIGGFIVYWAVLICLFLAALLIWCIAKIKGVALGYKKSYQLGIHLLTLPLIVALISSVFAFQISIPFFFTVLLLILAVFNIEKKVA